MMISRIGLSALFALAAIACGVDERQQIAKKSGLRTNLHALREVIDAYQGDREEYPRRLEDLVPRYLREIPYDPFTKRNDTWVLIREDGSEDADAGIVDVRSGAEGEARDGMPYRDF